jgi:hypothetical protein
VVVDFAVVSVSAGAISAGLALAAVVLCRSGVARRIVGRRVVARGFEGPSVACRAAAPNTAPQQQQCQDGNRHGLMLSGNKDTCTIDEITAPKMDKS